MNLRILMVGNDAEYLNIDALILRQKGFRVYLSDNFSTMDEMVEEIKPDVIFINWQRSDEESSDLYHALLDNIRYASIPVVYTLSEDDVYLINRKRTVMKERRYITCDNVIDAIKTALETPASAVVKKRVRVPNPEHNNIAITYRNMSAGYRA